MKIGVLVFVVATLSSGECGQKIPQDNAPVAGVGSVSPISTSSSFSALPTNSNGEATNLAVEKKLVDALEQDDQVTGKWHILGKCRDRALVAQC